MPHGVIENHGRVLGHSCIRNIRKRFSLLRKKPIHVL